MFVRACGGDVQKSFWLSVTWILEADAQSERRPQLPLLVGTAHSQEDDAETTSRRLMSSTAAGTDRNEASLIVIKKIACCAFMK